EDETIRYLYFLQRAEPGEGPDVPHPELWDESDEEGGEPEPEPVSVAAVSRTAQASVMDFTRRIEQKKEKELADLDTSWIGTSGMKGKAPVIAKEKAGRNDP